jgi:hypothetical protein
MDLVEKKNTEGAHSSFGCSNIAFDHFIKKHSSSITDYFWKNFVSRNDYIGTNSKAKVLGNSKIGIFGIRHITK